MDIPLVGAYIAREMPWAELMPKMREHQARVFSNTWAVDTARLLSAEEIEASTMLSARMAGVYSLSHAVYLDEEFVGWSFGLQQSRESYYMINSGILPEHQGKGVYSALLRHILARLTADGFQVVTSRHVVDNTRVIIPKLRAGFLIAGTELTDRFGALVLLSYFVNPKRRELYVARAGGAPPSGEVRNLLGLG